MMWVVALNGSKGVGKSTTVAAFLKKLPDTIALSLDKERAALGTKDTLAEKNRIAFKSIEQKLIEALRVNNNAIIDCGLSEERVASLRQLSNTHGATLHLVLLTASYNESVRRVRERDASKGRAFNKTRFDEVHKVVQAKDFIQFTLIDTSETSVDDTVKKIISLL